MSPKDTIEAHPRLIGALFTGCLLLTSVGNVVASTAGGNSGP